MPFACSGRLVVRRRSKRRVVRMYQTTCRSEQEQTTCRFSCQTTGRSVLQNSFSSLIKTTSFWLAKTTPFCLSPAAAVDSLFLLLLLRLLHSLPNFSLSLISLSHPDRLSSSPLFPVDRRRPRRYSLSLSSFFRHIFLYFVNMGPNEKLNF